MATKDIFVRLFHVTFKANLEGIIEEGGLIPGGNQDGLSKTIGSKKSDSDSPNPFVEDSKDKIFVSTQWAGTVRYIDHLSVRDELDKLPVILKISIPLDDFKDFDMFKDETDIPSAG